MLRIERLPETFDEFLMLQTLELVGNPILTKMHLQMNQKSGLVWVYRMLLGYVGWSNIPCDFVRPDCLIIFAWCILILGIHSAQSQSATGRSQFDKFVSGFQLTINNIHLLVGRGNIPTSLYPHVWSLSSFLQHLLQMARRDCWFLPRHKDDRWGGVAATQFCG